jgi:hypothetical protein
LSFIAITNAALGSVGESNSIVVQGIDTAMPISIAGGDYSVNGGGYTSASGSVNNGDSSSLDWLSLLLLIGMAGLAWPGRAPRIRRYRVGRPVRWLPGNLWRNIDV